MGQCASRWLHTTPPHIRRCGWDSVPVVGFTRHPHTSGGVDGTARQSFASQDTPTHPEVWMGQCASRWLHTTPPHIRPHQGQHHGPTSPIVSVLPEL
eukprot:353694-Chlamydomonas_euryale.AAC.1